MIGLIPISFLFKGNPPSCLPIVSLCRDLGILHRDNNGLSAAYKNCLVPVFQNGKLAHITIDENIVKNCLAFIEERRKKVEKSVDEDPLESVAQ